MTTRASRLTALLERQRRARQIIDSATEDGGYATLSRCTDPAEELVQWRTAECLAERLSEVYKITASPLGDYRRIHNQRIRAWAAMNEER